MTDTLCPPAQPHDGAWTVAYRRNFRRVEQHPAFPRLVRAVAVGEQPKGPPMRLRLNSPTGGSWWTRGMRPTRFDPHGRPGTFGWRDKAWKIAGDIAADLNLLPDSPAAEGTAAAYGVARQWVDARCFPGGRP